MKLAPTILGQSGLPLVDLSGERAWKQANKGDITMSLQWIDIQLTQPDYDEEGPVPCMVLFHSHRRMETGAYVIPMSKAHNYIGTDGRPTLWFHKAIAGAVLEIGFEPSDRSAINRVHDLIYENLVDLFKMPTMQPDDLHVAKAVQGIEMAIRVNGKTIHQEVV